LLGAIEPPQSEGEHNERGDDAQPGRGKRRGAEERHRDRVLDRGRAGERRHGEGRGAEHDRRRHQPAGDPGGAEQRLRHRSQNEEGDEQADAAIGDGGAGEHDGEHRAALAELLGHEAGDGGDRAAILHQLAEHRAEQKQRKELRQESRGAAHEGLRPVGEQRLAAKGGGNERCGWRQHQHAPAAEREPDQKQQTDEDAEQSHLKGSDINSCGHSGARL
jgi:hypothetical protein